MDNFNEIPDYTYPEDFNDNKEDEESKAVSDFQNVNLTALLEASDFTAEAIGESFSEVAYRASKESSDIALMDSTAEAHKANVEAVSSITIGAISQGDIDTVQSAMEAKKELLGETPLVSLNPKTIATKRFVDRTHSPSYKSPIIDAGTAMQASKRLSAEEEDKDARTLNLKWNWELEKVASKNRSWGSASWNFVVGILPLDNYDYSQVGDGFVKLMYANHPDAAKGLDRYFGSDKDFGLTGGDEAMTSITKYWRSLDKKEQLKYFDTLIESFNNVEDKAIRERLLTKIRMGLNPVSGESATTSDVIDIVTLIPVTKAASVGTKLITSPLTTGKQLIKNLAVKSFSAKDLLRKAQAVEGVIGDAVGNKITSKLGKVFSKKAAEVEQATVISEIANGGKVDAILLSLANEQPKLVPEYLKHLITASGGKLTPEVRQQLLVSMMPEDGLGKVLTGGITGLSNDLLKEGMDDAVFTVVGREVLEDGSFEVIYNYGKKGNETTFRSIIKIAEDGALIESAPEVQGVFKTVLDNLGNTKVSFESAKKAATDIGADTLRQEASFLDWFRYPKTKFTRLLYDTRTSAVMESSGIKNTLSANMQKLYKSIPKKGREESLDRIYSLRDFLQEEGIAGVKRKVTELELMDGIQTSKGTIKLTEQEAKIYKQVDSIMDDMHVIASMEKRALIASKGGRQLFTMKNGKVSVIELEKEVLAQEMYNRFKETGKVIVRVIDAKGRVKALTLQSQTQFNEMLKKGWRVFKKDIKVEGVPDIFLASSDNVIKPPSFNPVPYIPNFTPRSLDPSKAKFMIDIVDDFGRKLRAPLVTDSRLAAEKFVAKYAGEGTTAIRELGETVALHSPDDYFGQASTLVGRNTGKRAVDTVEFVNAAGDIVGKAPYRSYMDAMQIHLDKIARRLPIYEVVDDIKKEWLATAAKIAKKKGMSILEDPTDFNSPIKNLAKDSVEKYALETQRKYVMELAGMQTSDVVLHRALIKSIGRRLEGSFIDKGIKIGKGIEFNPRLMIYNLGDRDVWRGLGSFQYHTMLGMGNMGQFFVQSSQAMIAFSLDPIHAPESFLNSFIVRHLLRVNPLEANYDDILKQITSSMRLSKEASEELIYLTKLLNETGFAANAKVAPEIGEKLVGKAFKGKLSKALDLGTIPVTEGELMGRVMSMTSTYKRLTKAGALKGLSKEEAKAELLRQTLKFTFNLTEANKPEWAKGALGALTRFQSAMWQFSGMLAGQDLTLKQKGAVVAGQWLLFGAGAVPFVESGFDYARTSLRKMGILEEEVDAVLKVAQQGFIESAFGVDFSGRLAFMGQPPPVAEILQDETDWGKVVGVTSMTFDKATNFLESCSNMMAIATNPEANLTAADMEKFLFDVTSPVTSLSNLNKARIMMQYGKTPSSKGEIMFDDPTKMEIMMQSMGFGSQRANDLWKVVNQDIDRKDTIKKATLQAIELTKHFKLFTSPSDIYTQEDINEQTKELGVRLAMVKVGFNLTDEEMKSVVNSWWNRLDKEVKSKEAILTILNNLQKSDVAPSVKDAAKNLIGEQ